MSLFGKNPNEANYVGGTKHFFDVLKNNGNTNSVLVVSRLKSLVVFLLQLLLILIRIKNLQRLLYALIGCIHHLEILVYIPEISCNQCFKL